MAQYYVFDDQFFGDNNQFDVHGHNDISINETVTVGSGSVARVLGAKRTISDPSNSVSDAIDRIQGHVRDISESTGISGAVARLVTSFRIITEPNISVIETLSRIYNAVRTLTEAPLDFFDSAFFGDSNQFDVKTQGSYFAYDTITRRYGAVRNATETTLVDDTVARVVSFFRIITEPSISVNDVVDRLRTSFRTMAETVTNSDSVDRILGAVRAMTENETISDSVDRLYEAKRVINESAISAIDSLTRQLGATRQLSEPSITVMDSVVSLFVQVRIMIETTTVSEILTTLKSRLRLATAYLTKRLSDAYQTMRESTSYLTKRDNADGDQV